MIQVRLKYKVEAGPDLIPSRSGVQTFRSAGLYRYQHVEVDSSLFVSERICGVRCRKLRHYSIIPFLLSLSVYSELNAIKTFTGINLAQSLHTLVQMRACLISIGWPSWFKTEIFPTLPRPPVSKTYETVTPLCRIEPNREFCEPLHP